LIGTLLIGIGSSIFLLSRWNRSRNQDIIASDDDINKSSRPNFKIHSLASQTTPSDKDVNEIIRKKISANNSKKPTNSSVLLRKENNANEEENLKFANVNFQQDPLPGDLGHKSATTPSTEFNLPILNYSTEKSDLKSFEFSKDEEMTIENVDNKVNISRPGLEYLPPSKDIELPKV